MGGFFNLPTLMFNNRKRRVFENQYDYTPPIPDIMTPPINPNVPVNNPTIQPVKGGHNTLANIFDAIAAGAAIFGSDNPGQTLMQQLTQRRQEQMQKQQYEFERQKQERQIQAQQQEAATQRTFETGERLGKQQYGSEEAQKEREQQIHLTDIKFLNDTKLQEQHAKTQQALQEARQLWETGEGQKNRDFQIKLQQERDKGDIKQVEMKATLGALLSVTKYHQMISFKDVMNIMNKLENNIAFDEKDFQTVDRARKIVALESSAAAGNGVSAKELQKFQLKNQLQSNNDRQELMKSILTHYEEPQINPITNLPAVDINGKPLMQPASKEKLLQRVSDALDIYDTVNQKQLQTQQPQKQMNGGDIVDGLIKQGQSPQQILNMLDDPRIDQATKDAAMKRLRTKFKGSPLKALQ